MVVLRQKMSPLSMKWGEGCDIRVQRMTQGEGSISVLASNAGLGSCYLGSSSYIASTPLVIQVLYVVYRNTVRSP